MPQYHFLKRCKTKMWAAVYFLKRTVGNDILIPEVLTIYFLRLKLIYVPFSLIYDRKVKNIWGALILNIIDNIIK